MTKTQDLLARADRFAGRAARAKGRTSRNTYLSLEQSFRNLAGQREEVDTDAREDGGADEPNGAATA